MKLLIRTTILVSIGIVAVNASDPRNPYIQHLHDTELQSEAERQRNSLQPGNLLSGQTQSHPQLQQTQHRPRDPNQPYTLERINAFQPIYVQPRDPNQPFTLERVDPSKPFRVYRPGEETQRTRKGKKSLEAGASHSGRIQTSPREQQTVQRPRSTNEPYTLERMNPSRPIHVGDRDSNKPYTLERVDPSQPINSQSPKGKRQREQTRGKNSLEAVASRNERIKTHPQLLQQNRRDSNEPSTQRRVDGRQPDPEQLPRYIPQPRIEEPDTTLKL